MILINHLQSRTFVHLLNENDMNGINSFMMLGLRDGNITDIEQAGSLHQYLNILHEEYGDIVAFQYETNLVVSISHPELFAPRSQVCEIPSMLFSYCCVKLWLLFFTIFFAL